jgi:hypothetical protein
VAWHIRVVLRLREGRFLLFLIFAAWSVEGKEGKGRGGKRKISSGLDWMDGSRLFRGEK